MTDDHLYAEVRDLKNAVNSLAVLAGRIEERVNKIPTEETINQKIEKALDRHVELFCNRYHTMHPKGKSKLDLKRLAKFLGWILGTALLALAARYGF